MNNITDFSEHYKGVSNSEDVGEKNVLVEECNRLLCEIEGLIARFMARARRFPPSKDVTRAYKLQGRDIIAWPVVMRKDGLYVLGCDGALYDVAGAVFADIYPTKRLAHNPDTSVRVLAAKKDALISIKNGLSNPDFGKILPTLAVEPLRENNVHLDDPFWKRIRDYAKGVGWMALIVSGVVLFGIWMLFIRYYPHYNL